MAKKWINSFRIELKLLRRDGGYGGKGSGGKPANMPEELTFTQNYVEVGVIVKEIAGASPAITLSYLMNLLRLFVKNFFSDCNFLNVNFFLFQQDFPIH